MVGQRAQLVRGRRVEREPAQPVLQQALEQRHDVAA
jgi:hypothetical protein